MSPAERAPSLRAAVPPAVRAAVRAVVLGGAVLLTWFGLRLAALGGSAGRARRGGRALHLGARLILHALGITLDVTGRPRSGASLVVGNHVCWLDVLVLSACAPQSHVTGGEVGASPLLGLAASRAGALFVRGGAPRELPALVEEIARMLRRGYRVQVFPEVTAGRGSAVRPFTRAAFQAAIDAAVVISPVSLAYTDRAGRPVSAEVLQPTAVPTAVPTPALIPAPTPSLRDALALPALTVRVRWLPVIPAIAGTGCRSTDRAIAAALAERAVARDLGQPVLSGRGDRRPIRVPSTPARRPQAAAEPAAAVA